MNKKGMCILGIGMLVAVIIFASFSVKKYAKANDAVNKGDELTKELEAELDLKATEIIKLYFNQEYGELYNKFSEEAKSKISTELLKNQFDAYNVIFHYKNVCNDFYIEKKDNWYIVYKRYECEGMKIKGSVTLNNNYEIEGINLCDGRYYLDTKFETAETDQYREDVVKIGEHNISGILTLPKNKEKAPVVIIVSGSGPSSADGLIGLCRVYKDIAHGLAKKGVATLRYNDRYFETDLYSKNDTIYDETINDAGAAVKLLSKDERVDTNNIYIVGHSLGGMVAPKIAELNPEVKGIVSMAGSPRSYMDIMIDQCTLSINEIQKKLEYEGLDDKIKKDCLDEIERVKGVIEEYRMLKSIIEGSEEIVLDCTKTCWRSLNDLNTSETVKNLDIPFLIQQGQKDVQVYAGIDFVQWKILLGDRDNCHFRLYENLNHCFIKSKGNNILNPTGDYWIQDNVDEIVISDIAEFVNKYSR